MLHRLALPDLGEGVAEGEVIAWLVEPGQAVMVDEPIVEVETDKAQVVIPSPVTGVVRALCVEPGHVIPVGTALAEIEDSHGVVLEAGDDADGPTAVPPSPPAPASAASDTGVVALPAVRKLARELGVDLATVHPSGPGGRITADDLHAAAGQPATRPRHTITRRLSAAAAVPTVTNVDEADFEAVRTAGRPPLVALARAVVVALGDHPGLNAWWRDDGTQLEHEAVHLGVATQTPVGLVVPVVRDAHLLGTDELAVAIAEQTSAAREGRARPDQLRGSTVTLTSAGRVSGLFATPLLNPPEIAIVGLYRIAERAVVRDGSVVARHTGHLSVTFDHRAIDGIEASEFLARIIEIVESWPSEPADARQ